MRSPGLGREIRKGVNRIRGDGVDAEDRHVLMMGGEVIEAPTKRSAAVQGI